MLPWELPRRGAPPAARRELPQSKSSHPRSLPTPAPPALPPIALLHWGRSLSARLSPWGDLPGVRYGEKKGKVRRGEGGGERGGRKGKEMLIMWAWGPPCGGSTVSLLWCGDCKTSIGKLVLLSKLYLHSEKPSEVTIQSWRKGENELQVCGC